MEFNCIFPVTVAVSNLERSLTDIECVFLENLEKLPSSGHLVSSDYYVLDQPELKELKNFIEKELREYYQTVYSADESQLVITQSWVNYSTKNNIHNIHIHPNSFISGVFYAKADSSQDAIIFHKNLYESAFDVRPKEENFFNVKKQHVPVNSGMLILFPSTLMHEVPMIDTDRTRVSIAFNSFFTGKIGSYDHACELVIKDN